MKLASITFFVLATFLMSCQSEITQSEGLVISTTKEDDQPEFSLEASGNYHIVSSLKLTPKGKVADPREQFNATLELTNPDGKEWQLEGVAYLNDETPDEATSFHFDWDNGGYFEWTDNGQVRMTLNITNNLAER